MTPESSLVKTTLGTKEVWKFPNHPAADAALANLTNEISLTDNDPSYTQRIKPFAEHLEKSNPAQFQRVGALIDKYLAGGMGENAQKRKDAFKNAWRDLAPGTDEHVSTQNVYMIVETIRANNLHESSVDPKVLKDTMSVWSHFRYPTEFTGHASGNYQLGHPHGDKPSLWREDKKATEHGDFDMYRRTAVIRSGESHHNTTIGDGTGAFLAMLNTAAVYTINVIGSALASDVSIQPKISLQVKQQAADLRESLKADHNFLMDNINPEVQPYTAPQFHGMAPQEQAMIREKTLTLSPLRVPSNDPRLVPTFSLTQSGQPLSDSKFDSASLNNSAFNISASYTLSNSMVDYSDQSALLSHTSNSASNSPASHTLSNSASNSSASRTLSNSASNSSSLSPAVRKRKSDSLESDIPKEVSVNKRRIQLTQSLQRKQSLRPKRNVQVHSLQMSDAD